MEWPDAQELRDEMRDCERAGDRITHDVIHQLHTVPQRTFDREDIYALAAAVDDVIDPTVIIRWKDLFERLEDAIDSCERAAHILEGIAVKQA
jgi:uncharacterized protein Yka (UPF0111/DUF47 family)